MERELFPQSVFCGAVVTSKFEVFEELEAGTFVADMSEVPVVGRLLTFKGTIRFQFQGLVPQSSFSINETTGVIRTARKLDRKNLSLFDDKFQLQVKISKGIITTVIPTEIKILDINDNNPKVYGDCETQFSV